MLYGAESEPPVNKVCAVKYEVQTKIIMDNTVMKYPDNLAAVTSVHCVLAEVDQRVSQEPAQNAIRPKEKAINAINT